MPTSCLEAMSFALVPVLVESKWFQPDIWQNHKTAVSVDDFDSKKYAHEIMSLLRDGKTARRIGFEAKKLVDEKFNLSKQCKWLVDNLY